MKYQELLILLPCHSLEDFPTHHEGDEAHSLLASWSALWHPALIAAAGQAPGWRRVDDPPTEVRERLIVVPSVCASRLPTGFGQRVKDEGGILIRKTDTREEIIAAALAGLHLSFPGSTLGMPAPEAPASSPPELRTLNPEPFLTPDFLALGYCYLQIELLTRQMRYASNLDETYFKNTAVAAAQAAMEGNADLAKEKLSACFSLLAEERDHYYPVDAFILDLNLTAETTLGEPLRAALSKDAPTNLLLSASVLQQMATQEPATLALLKERLASGGVSLIGGETSEDRLPLLSQESILANLRQGLATYQNLVGHRPNIFGRRRFGLTPNLPGLLHKLGFQGALHANLEEGKTPDGMQFKIRWEGLDGSAIDAIAKPPLDAAKPQTFLALATKLGESMDTDHVATLCLAHWPGQTSPWLEDLRLIAKYCSALGKWVTADEYFAKTDHPGQLDRFEAHRYRSPYLKQAIIRKQDDPISTSIRYWEQHTAGAVSQAMETLTVLVTGIPVESRMSKVECQEEKTVESFSTFDLRPSTFDNSNSASQLADALTSNTKSTTSGTLVINPASFIRRLGVESIPGTALPTVERPIYAADRHNNTLHAVVDVPAFGFVHITPSNAAPPAQKTLLLAENLVLRNEFFEAIINPTTGSLSAIHEYKSRGNRVSQQLALRSPAPRQKPGDTKRDGDEFALYSTMAADAIETTIATTTLGEIVTRGRLLDQAGAALATFTQRYRLWRGSRVLHLEIEIEPTESPKADPWNSYYCARFAWADESAELFRTVNQTRQIATEKRFEAPHYIDIVGDKQGTAILTGGLPFHQRSGDSMLDSILITKGESQRKFRLGIGVDLTHPLHEATSLLTPPIVLHDHPQPASGPAGWLLHLSAKNVIVTSLTPLLEDGRLTGFRARLLETTGRPANLTLSAFRPIKSATVVDFLGNSLSELKVEDGKLKLDLSAHEWTEIIARW